MKAEVNAEIDRLMDLKRDIMEVVKAVDDPELQTLLELRYLCFKDWPDIACADALLREQCVQGAFQSSAGSAGAEIG